MSDPAGAAASERDWQALPNGVLRHIFVQASTSQTPGSCLASHVCRTWRSAAAGCRGVCLLYHAGYDPQDQSFAAWLEQNSPQLEALTISTVHGYCEMVLEAMAAAAAAAQAAGQPLQLQTLRVLGELVELPLTGRLLAGLPQLRCVQLNLDQNLDGDRWTYDAADTHLQESLAPLQAASQLEQLYLEGPDGGQPLRDMSLSVAQLLPLSLKRFSWRLSSSCIIQDLSHLTRLTFLQLCDIHGRSLHSEYMPPGLQEVQLLRMSPKLPAGQQPLVTRFKVTNDSLQQLKHLPNLTAADVSLWREASPAVRAALAPLSNVSSLSCEIEELPKVLAAGGGMQALRRLHLGIKLRDQPGVAGLAALTGVTHLVLSGNADRIRVQACRAVAADISALTVLKWLSVPDVLLRVGQPWLSGLQQLRVLVLQHVEAGTLDGGTAYAGDVSLLEGSSLQALPASLRVLCWSSVSAERAAEWQLRRRLRQLVSSSDCQVLVGVDLDEVADPTWQLAGVPLSLQQVLP